MTVIAANWTQTGAALGGDSGAFEDGGNLKMLTADPKVFKFDAMLAGVAGSFRVINLVGRAEVKDVFGLRDYLQKEITGDSGEWSVLCATKDGLFEIADDFSVIHYREPYASIGAGNAFATGALSALSALEGLSPKDRVQLALSASGKHSTMCAPPFKIFQIFFEGAV